MSYEVEAVDAITRRIRFQIPVERISTELSTAYRQLSGRVRLPGFRRGKVPRNVLEMRFGKQICAEVAGKLIQEGWDEVRPELAVVGQPGVVQDGVKPGQAFEFALVVEVKPQVVLGTYRGVDVPWVQTEIPSAVVEEAIAKRLEAAARIVEIEDPAHAIAAGDIVVTELVLREGAGDDVREILREAGTSIRVGDERYYPGVDALLVGLCRGGTREGAVTIPDSSELEQLRGRTFAATVKVLSIQTSRAPLASDEAARELGYEGGLEGMHAAIREQIAQPLAVHARSQARSQLLSKLVEAHAIEAPRALVGKQLELLVMERRVMHHYQGGKPGTLDLGPTVMDKLRERAVYAVKAGLLLEAIGAAEGMAITDQDLEDTYQRIADERGQRVEAVKGYLLQEEGAVETLRSRLLEEKVLDWLFEHANLVAPSVDPTAAPSGEPAPAPSAAPAPAPAWNASMKKDELLEIARGQGLEVTSKSTKAQILEALEASRT